MWNFGYEETGKKNNAYICIMILRKFRVTIALLLIVCLSEVIVPGYYLHLFFHHHEADHVHCIVSDSEQVGTQHEHCSHLEFAVPTLAAFHSDASPAPAFSERIFHVPVSTREFTRDAVLPSLRGPPQV